MARLLICEGGCNPNRSMIDDLVVQTVRTSRAWTPPYGDDQLWALQRTLRHTPHAQVKDGVWQCLVCGTERRYGRGRMIYYACKQQGKAV